MRIPLLTLVFSLFGIVLVVFGAKTFDLTDNQKVIGDFLLLMSMGLAILSYSSA